MKLISNLSAIDRQATEDLGIPSLLLMEAAGRRVAEVVLETFKTYEIDALSANVVIFCGPGNNGGDGFVCARYLQQALDSQRFYGDITVVHLSAAEQYQGDAKTNLQLLQHYGFDDDGYFSLVSAQSDDSSEASLALASADLVVDAIFGSGLSRPPKDHYKYWIDEINDSEVPVVSIDLPSGINNQTGQVLDKAIKADETVTFMVSKPGLYLSPGRSYTGSVTVVDIGIPKPLIKNDPSPYRLTTEGFVKKMLPQHHEDSHKYDVGSLLVLAGSGTMPGAAQLCCLAALNSGAGMVTLAAPASVLKASNLPPEVIRCPLPENENGEITLEAFETIRESIADRKIRALAIGPGLGSSMGVLSVVEKLLAVCKAEQLPVVIDADGLNVLAFLIQQGKLPEVKDWLGAHCVLTPHVGEAARLLHTETESINAKLLASAEKGQKTLNCQFVLKSATTVTAGTDGKIYLNPTGNKGMATAGSGDVLTGIIGSLLAQQASPQKAGTSGVYLHGLAGDLACAEFGTAGVTASRITEFIPQAIKVVLTE